MNIITTITEQLCNANPRLICNIYSKTLIELLVESYFDSQLAQSAATTMNGTGNFIYIGNLKICNADVELVIHNLVFKRYHFNLADPNLINNINEILLQKISEI